MGQLHYYYMLLMGWGVTFTLPLRADALDISPHIYIENVENHPLVYPSVGTCSKD
jgi:hypothetical protein